MDDELEKLTNRVLSHDENALARLISVVEDRKEGYTEVIKKLHPRSGTSHIIGITGSPGSGKSTLVDVLSGLCVNEGLNVGVIAVDPNSPYSGGAVLGDRIRFREKDGEGELFFRSMSTRGALGGLSSATNDIIRVYDAYGMDVILVETVGAGQNEVEIVETADTVVVLVIPTAGDDVQMLKAGILEIGDLFVVNKSDLSGADRTTMEVREMIDRSRREDGESEWERQVINTVATKEKNIDQVWDEIQNHRQYLDESGEYQSRRIKRCSRELKAILEDRLRLSVEEQIEEFGGLEELAREIALNEVDPYTSAERVIANRPRSGGSSS